MTTAPSSCAQHNAPNQKHEVMPLELFFDLAFVFAVSQLSHHLLEHLSWYGTLETLVLLVAVFTVWFTTRWAATAIPVAQSRTQWMVFAVMLLGLFMNAAVVKSFSTSGWVFVVPMLLIQLGRTVWFIVNAPDAVFRDHFFRNLLWLLATTPLWIVGAIMSAEVRLLWWGVAAIIDLTGRWLTHPIPGRRLHSENIGFEGGHMLERCRLFLLIALGETVFTTGTAIADASVEWMTSITGTVALTGTAALWALGFGRADRLTMRQVEDTRDPIRATRLAGNALTIRVAGLIAVAVANEKVITHPNEHMAVAVALLLFGGPVLFLLAEGWYLWAVPHVWPRVRFIGSAALVLVGFATRTAPSYIALILAGVTLATLALLDQS